MPRRNFFSEALSPADAVVGTKKYWEELDKEQQIELLKILLAENFPETDKDPSDYNALTQLLNAHGALDAHVAQQFFEEAQRGDANKKTGLAAILHGFLNLRRRTWPRNY